MRRIQFMILAVAVTVALPLCGQTGSWSFGTANIYTTNYVSIGNTTPYYDTSLRLANPVGATGALCNTYQPEIYKCFQLTFGTSSAQYWGFRLDNDNNLNLSRQSNGGWKKGFAYSREGNMVFFGGYYPLRVEGTVTSYAEFRDMAPTYSTGMQLYMPGNSIITVGTLDLGAPGVPLIRSNTQAPLYLNTGMGTATDVVIGEATAGYATVGLKVESGGKSTFRGSVEIGAPTPNAAYRLNVKGDAHFEGTVTGTNIKAKYQDVAEWVPSATDLSGGTVVVLDSARSNHVTASARAYDTSVAGVVSPQPGIALGDAGESKALVATMGRVRVRVDASRQPIAIGDLLVTSDKPGVAMKSIPLDVQGVAMHRPGTVLGKALEPLSSGEGEILVLLSLQ